jgi:1-acyl-sn-glycerol-3-phosphate acyltransferase
VSARTPAAPLRFVEGAYRTEQRPLSLLARALPAALFYARIASVVWRAGVKSKRGAYPDAAWGESSLETVRAIEEIGVPVEIEGVDNLAGVAGPCVIIGNHMSTFETFALPTIILTSRPGERVTFVVKRSLVDYPVFGHVMRSRDPIVVGRSNPRDDLKAVLEGGEERLRAGVSIIVFPQTTRTPVFDPAAFNTIGVKLARRAGVPVVPLALKTDAWGNGRLLKEVGRIDTSRTAHFAFGAPLRVGGRGTEEHQRIVDFIREHLTRWGGSVAAAAAADGGAP